MKQMDYDNNGTLYHLNCGICGRTFWSHDAFANVCSECAANMEQIDMVAVVRCKDCKHHKKDTCSANAGMAFPPPDDWFCADGERK